MIQNTPKRLFRKAISKYFIPHTNFSYSQFGEDLIISSLFYQLKISKPKYLDIGANEPKFISNTYYFYEHGGSGICIEPNPFLYKKIMRERSRDIVINAGIGVTEKDEADFFLFPESSNGLSTFSEKEALHWQNVGMKGIGRIGFEKVIKMQLITINRIFEKYNNISFDLLSIDVEGMDFEILKSMNFSKYRPKVICAETLSYDAYQNSYKNDLITDLLSANGYILYADTRVNSIYCLTELINR